MEDCVVRSGRREGFTVLYNTMITDKRLSLKARGLFAVMMSRPDEWKFSVSGLAAFTGEGKDAIRSGLMELERVGYLLREQGHKDDGTFGGNVYILQDFAPPLSGKPDNGEIPLSGNTDDGENRQRETPLSGNPTQRNKDLKERKTKEPPVYPTGDDPFLTFWKAYPKKVKKKRAWKIWCKLQPDTALVSVIMDALDKQKRSDRWRREDGRYIPDPTTWLDGHRWEDELPEAADRRSPTREEYGWQ